MTLDLTAIRARERAVTKGPWRWQASPKGYPQQIVANDDGLTLIADTYVDPAWYPAEAEFIAHARTDIPALCDEVERLRAFLNEAEAILEEDPPLIPGLLNALIARTS